MTINNIASFIDHTLLKPDATPDMITQLCTEAKQHQFASVCVNPTHVKLCAALLKLSTVKVCTVIGFPLGANITEVKVFEAQKAISQGATEIDMVINIGALKSGQSALVKDDIKGVVAVAHEAKVLVKVIIETALLTDEEKVLACLLAKDAGADFVKTSTGFSGGGATIEDVRLMRTTVGPDLGVKASGGIRNAKDAERFVAAGADRLGTSSGVLIMGEAQKHPVNATSSTEDNPY